MNVRKQAEKIIEGRRLLAEDIAEKNKLAVLKNPEIRDLYYASKSLILEIAKIEVDGRRADEKRKEYARLRTKMDKALKKLGVEKSSLKPNYFCKKCNDTGYVSGSDCTCLKREISLLLLKESGLDVNRMAKFDNDFSMFDNPELVGAIYSKMKKLVSGSNETAYRVALIAGDTGVGKTHLTECMATYAISLGKSVKYVSAFNFNSDMLKYHLASIENKESIIEPYLTSEILFIDDLGSENKINNVTNEYLYLVLNERMSSGRLTVITTNLDFGAIQQVYGERIFSRLMHKSQSLKVNFVGADLRVKSDQTEQKVQKKNSTSKKIKGTV